jgi:hypothetical protein
MAEGPQVEFENLGRGDEVAQPTRSGKMETGEALETHAIARAQSTGEKSDTLAVRENGGPRGNPIRIKGLAIALGVENREPRVVSKRVSVDHGRVYCWIHVTNGKGKRIIVRWISKGKELWETRLSIGSNDWRTWAYITLRPGMIGPAQADILDEKGGLLHTTFFEITG